MDNCLKMPTYRFRKFLASLFVFAALNFGAWAQTQTVTYTWTGADTTNPTLWSEPGNWTKKTVIDTDPDNPVIENPATTVPGTGDSVIIPNTTNKPVITSYTNKVAGIEIQTDASLFILCSADLSDLTSSYPATFTNNGTLYFYNTNNTPTYTLTTPVNAELGKLYVWGKTIIEINGDCSATSIKMEPDKEANQVSSNFTVKLSEKNGSADKLTIGAGSPAVNLTRASATDDVIGTFEIDVKVTCTGTLDTHSGVTLKIDADKTLTVGGIYHTATSGNPVSKIEIYGTVDVSSGTLALSNGNAGSTQVVIDENGRLIANKIESGVNSYSNGTGTNAIVNPIINNGSIEISESFTIPNYTNTGDFYPYSGDGKIILTADGAKFDNKDTTHTVTVNKLQCLDSSVISGTTTFKTFTAENLSDKSLTITGEQTIQTGITLSGTDTQLLTITGSGTINTTNLTAEYLSIDENIKLKNYTASIDHCEPAAGSSDASWLKVIQNGWAIKALKNFDFTWTGNTDSNWNEKTNWDTLLVPEADCKIIIPTGCTNYPELGSGTYNGGTLTLSASDSKITLGAANLVLSGKENDTTATPTLSNAGTIVYTNTGRITNGTNPINDTTQGTVEYSNTGSGTITDFDTGSGDDYYKLVIKGTDWQLGSSLKLNTITLDSGANCTLSAASTIQAVNFVFDGKFTSTYTLTLTPYTSTSDFEIPSTIGTFSLSGTNGWLYLGDETNFTGALIFNNALDLSYKIKLNSTATLNKDIKVRNSVTATDAISGTGTLIFTGTETQQFTPTASKTYANIKVDKTNGSVTILNNDYTITNFSVENGTSTFSGDTTITNCTITKATSTTFNGTPTITNLSDDTTGGNIIFNKGANISNAVTLKTNGIVTFDGSKKDGSDNIIPVTFGETFEHTSTTGKTSVNGNINAAGFSAKNLVAAGNATINTGNTGAQEYGTINGSTSETQELTLTASAVTINDNVGKATGGRLKTLRINAPLTIGVTGKEISAKEIDFSGDISGTGKVLTINTEIIKSTAAASGSVAITLSALTFAADTEIQTENTSDITYNIPVLNGNGKTLTIATSGNNTFSGDVEINPKLVTSTGTTLTASTGEMTFKDDLNLTNGSFDAHGGTIILTAENKGDDPAVFNGGSKTFNKLTITGNANIAGNNIIGTLTASNLGDKEITFTAGSSQSVTSMTLTGTDVDHKLWLSSDGVWNISCTNEPELRFLRVKNSTNNTSPATNFVAFKSTDAGNNTNWNFPDMKYIWEGNDSTVWNLKTNWKDSVIPTKGATIEIQVSTAGNYPKLTADLDLNTTLINASGDPVPYNAIITIFNNAELDLDANKIKVGKIINNGLLKLNGNTSDQITGDTLNGTETDATPTIEYTGTGTTTYFVWDGDADTDGKQYVNLVLNRTNAVVSEKLFTTGNLTIKAAASVSEDIEVSNVLTINAATTIAADKSIFAKGDVTSTANVDGNGKLIFTGSANQTFAAGSKTYSNIEEAKDGNGNLTVNTNLTVTNFTITSGAQTVFAGAPTITTLAAENTTGTIAFNGGGNITNDVEFKTAGQVTFGDANTDSITFSNNVTHTAGPTQITGTLNAANLTLGVLTIPVGAVTILNTSGNQNYNGAISGGGTLTINSGTTGTINFNAAVNGTTPLSSLTTTGAVVINSSLIKTSGAQTYNSTIDLGSPTSIVLEGTAITFNNDVSDTTPATSLEINAPATINCSNITTAGNQIYDNTITLKKSPTLTAGTSVTFKNNIANSASAPADTSLTVKANVVIDAANLSITTSEFDFSGNISGSGTNNILTLSTPVLKSIADTSSSSDITLSKLIINQDTTLQTANSTQINAYISEINNSGKTLIIDSSVSNLVFKKETTVNSHIQTKDGSKLTAWSGTTTFNGDIEITGDFEHSNGTVKFAGATQTLKTRTDGSTNFYNILISSSDKVTTDSSFIVSGTSWTSSTSTQNFTATAGTITFDNATASAASPTTVSGKNNFYDVVCKTAGQNITFEADNIFSNTVTIGDSTATPSAIMTGTVNISSSEAITFNPNLYCNKLTINAGTKNVSFNGNATYGEAFTNNGTGNSVFKASFTGTGNAIFNGDIYITDNATPRSFSAGSGKKIETNKNIIVDTTDTNIININTHTDSLVKAYNFVLYSGKVSLDGTLDTKGSTDETTGDIILLGPDYTTIDPQTGIDGIYLYNQTRSSSANFTTAFRAIPYNGEVTISSGATMQAGKNFYANGLSLNGTGEWNLKLTKTSDSVKGFAEAIKTEVSNCKVSCHQDTSTATDDTAPAKVVAYECTDNSGNTNWNFDDFKILNAWTVRDNAIYVEFNAPVRNLYNEIINSLSFLTYKGTASASTAFTGIYSTPDCQDANLIKDKNKDIELTNGRYSLYLKAPDSWNTDATGNSTGRSSLSSDRNGNHKSSIPYIDIPRSLSGTNYIITNRWGKRLNNYSTRTNTPGYSYGTNENTGNETYVLDKTGPVLWTVRTGQEMHDSYKTSDGENSQYDYDAHNFIEFRYSEPVTFNSDTIPDNAVNIPVTSSFGAVNTSSESDTLTFAGLANLEAPAGNTLQLYTGSNGSDDKLVNAFYRLDEYSIRISIAGWTDGTITDYTGNAFKKWPGYIEKASQFTGAKAKAVTTPLVQDKATTPNTQEEYDDGYKVEPLVYSDSSSANPSALLPLTRTKPDGTVSNADVYSPWDLSEPVFTPLRFSSGTAWGSDTMSEAIGNTNGTGSTLDRIDFHFFDNTPAYDSTDPAEWFTEIGWCSPGAEASKSHLLDASYTYCADIIGGARQFDTDENRRTTGGIRFSTKAGISPAFRYSTSMNDTNPSTSFLTGIANIHTTIVSQLFTGSSSPMRPANDPDGLYFGLGLTDTDLSVETTFAFTYNENLGYLTDLAGNRLRSKLSKTIDRTPPSFDAILSPVDTKSVYIIFVKELVTDSSKIKFSDNTGIKIEISESFAMLMPKCFRIISIDAGGNAVENSEIQIDTSVPAQIIAANSNESFTCLKLTTTEEIDIEHIKNLYVQLITPSEYPQTGMDPLTNNTGSRVTFIQDLLGNYMSMYSAHSLSDFAVNYVKPLYAYTTDMTENDASFMEGLYEEGSWAVHDWDADQQNYGTLPADHPIAIVADTNGNDKIRSYLSPAPDAASVSKQFNADFHTKLRIWLPALQDSVFRALSAANNTNFIWKDGSPMEDNPDNSLFELPSQTVSAWSNGSQISFMFSLMKDDTNPVRIYNNPYFDVSTDKFDLSLNLPVPLFCLRMPDVNDVNSLDLWSFKVRSVSEQRGGVSILNNVIDAGKNEKTVIKVNLAEEGKLNVMVMTLDGNIITYLNRGKTNAGEHYFTWNGRNRNGNIVARGMYFIRVIGSGIDETRKVMVVK